MQSLDRNRVQTDKFTLGLLHGDIFNCTCSFDCGNADLNDFFQNEARPHKEQLLAETYYIEPKEATDKGIFLPVAFVSYLNDAISIDRNDRKATKRMLWDHIRKNIPHPKRNYETFPAVKIGRLGVERDYQGHNIGSSILNMTKDLFTTCNRTGCRFLTVDAYRNDRVINFYIKNGFQFLWKKDEKDETRTMFFDLKRVTSEQS